MKSKEEKNACVYTVKNEKKKRFCGMEFNKLQHSS